MRMTTTVNGLLLAAALGGAAARGESAIRYAAEGARGEYCGAGYGIDVNVAAPASGATVRYALSQNGPWQNSILLTNACAATPVYFRIEASGYETVTDSRTVEITPKELTSDFVWLVLPAQDYVYDGTEKRPEAAFGDGEPSILTEEDFEVSYADNVDAGTATATFTGRRNYFGTVEEEFDILQATNEWTTAPTLADWTYGRTPSAPAAAAKFGAWSVSYPGGAQPTLPGTYTAIFSVPGTSNYTALRTEVPFRILPATIRYAAEGARGEYCGAGYGIDVSVAAPASGATVRYALSQNGPWQDSLLLTNACAATPVYFRIEASGYETVTDSRTVEITPKELTSDFVWLVLPAEDYVYDGTEKRPEAAFGDGEPSILAEGDFEVSYRDNVDAGTATATFTGRRNYFGTEEEEFDIFRRPLSVTAETKTKVYGTADPPLTYTAEGIVSGETPLSGVLSREPGEAVGTYAIQQGTLAASANYALSFTGADFTIQVTAPRNVSASDGTNEDCVEVTWTAVAGASHEVWRGAETASFGNAGKIGETANGTWIDETAVPGIVYRYWVRAVGGGLTSEPSASDTGWRAISDLFIGVTKEWDDNGNEAGYRPESVSFTLLADGAEISSTNLSGAAGWTAVWTVPKYANGREVAYAVREDDLPRAYDAFVATNGLDTLHNAKLGAKILTDSGWRFFIDIPLGANVWTTNGWKAILSAPISTLVRTDDISRGAMFCVTNKYMRPTTPTDLSVTGWSGAYDGAAHGIGATSATQGATFLYATAATGPYSAEKPVWRDAGGPHTTWVVAEAPYFAPVTNVATVTISKRPASIRSADATWTYDTTAHSKPEVVTSGFVTGEGVAVRDFASVTDITSATGVPNAFAFDWNAGTRAENYELAVEFGTLRVTPRIIGDDDANWDIRLGKNPTYDGTEKSAPVAQVCYVKPDGNLENIPYTLSGDKATDAGNYVLTITGTGNYAGSVNRDWAVMPRHLTLASGSAAWTYDGAAHSETTVAVGGDGFAPGEGADYSGFPSPMHVADAPAPGIDNAFSWTFQNGTKAGNYEVRATFGTVAVTPRAVTLTAPTKTKPYDGMPLTFGADEVVATLTGGALGERALPEGESFTFSDFASITDAGQVPATFAYASGTARTGDYAITIAEGATLTVTRSAAEIVVQAGSETWTYDGVAHSNRTWTATNLDTLVAGDELEVAFEADSVATRPTDGPALDGVVANRIALVRVLRGGAGGADVTANYALSWYPGTLRVMPRPVTLTSASAAKAYDGTPLVAHDAAVGGMGFVGNDGATFTFTGSRTEKGSSANAFTWAFKPGTNPAFYDVTATEGTLTVTALDIGGGDDSDWTVELGPALTYNGIEQVQTVRAATFRGLPVDYAVEDDRATDAGDYALTLVGQGNFTGRKQVAWRIAPKALSLAAGSATKVYDGTPLVCGDVTATGFVAGEGATYVCTGTRTDAGTSANEVGEIRWAAGTKGTNYAVTKTAGTLTVAKRPVTLTAPTKTKPYDGTPLTLGAEEIVATLTGGAPGERALPEGESFTFSDFASITDAGQCAATFAYAAGPGTNLANYDVTVAPGATLTVTGSATEITVIADSASWVFDGMAHTAPTWTAVNAETLTSGDALEVAFAEGCTVTHATDGPAGDGVVTNRIASVRVLRGGTEDVTRNYTLKSYNGTLRVTKRPAEVRVAGTRVEAIYDGAEHVAEGFGIEADDTLYTLSDAVFSGMARAARTDAGTTAMGLAADDFSNRNADFAVTFAVADGGVTISPADISGGGDGDFAIELGDDPLYNGTVQTVEIRSVTWKGLPVEHSLAGERATHAGTYALTVKGTGNFTGERTVRWGIRRRSVAMTSGSSEKVYDGTPLRNGAVSVTGDGFIGSEGATYDVTGSQTAAGSSENTFSYTLKAGTLSGDYDITTSFGALTVRKARHDVSRIAWNVAADAATFLYDGAPHGVALTGLPAGVTATYAGNVATNAGTYTATAHLVYDTANYEAVPDPEPLAWSITRRPITLFAASKDKPYDGWPLEVRPEDITVAGSGYAPGECFAYGDFASITDVGEIPATFSYSDSATAKVANYDVTVQGGQTLKVTVGGDQISVTADSGAWAYDGETHRKPTWTVFNGDKLLDGHAFDIAISADSAVTTPAEGIVSNAFDHVKIVESASGRDMTRNYNLFVYEGTLQVTNALIGPNMALDRTVEAVYDGRAHSAAVEAPILLTSATVRYRVGDGAWSATAPEWTHAGTYEAQFEVSAQFYDPATGMVQVAISPRPVTLSSPTKSKPYDGTPLTFGTGEITIGGEGFAAGESFVCSDFASITDAGRIDAAFAWAAGPGTLAADYAVTIKNGTLMVSKSAEEIVVTAKDGTWVFDGAAHSLREWTAENLDALATGDTLEVTFDPASAITAPGTAENAIAGVRVLRGGADVTANYTVSWWPGTLTVTPARIGPAMTGIATSATATYDGAGHAATVTAPTLLTRPVTVRYAATADGPWGATPVAFKDAGAWTSFFRVEAPCYEPYVGTATVTIFPREVTLVSSGATKVYDGTPLRKNEVTVRIGSLPFVAGEGFSATCAGTVTDVGGVENAFDYALTGGAKAGNYTIRKEYGWLRVTPAEMDVAALAAAASWFGPYDGEGHGAALAPPYPRAVVAYALEAGNEEAYGSESPSWVNVSTNTVYFKVLAPNYNPGYGAATVAITPRNITLAQIGTLTNEFYTGYPIEPVPTVSDTVPMTEDDWTVRWEDNVEAGTGKAIVCGRRNYGGEVVREFAIEYKPVVVIVIDLSNLSVGQGWWGTATLRTNSVPVPGIVPGTRTEVEVPTETEIDLRFEPDPGFRLGQVIVDNRFWTTNAVWHYESARADKSFDAGFLPAPETTIRWKKANATGHYHAQLSLPVHPGYEEALANLKFWFADRVQEGAPYAQLWDYTVPANRHVADVAELDGKEYRYVSLDASRMAGAADGARVSWGVSDATLASTVAAVPGAERLIGLYIRKRVSPVSGEETDAGVENFIGALSWETNGKTYYQPVGAGYENGIIAEKILDAEDLDAAEALGFDPAFLATAEPRCRFTDFTVDPIQRSVEGAFAIYAATPDGIEALSSGTTEKAVFRLWAADRPSGPWTEIDAAEYPWREAGAVGFAAPGTEAPTRFFRLTIEIRATHE